MLVGDEQDVARRQRLDDLQRVGRRAADVDDGFDRGAGIDVGDDGQVGKRFAQLIAALDQIVGVDTVGQRTAGAQIGKQYKTIMTELQGLIPELRR